MNGTRVELPPGGLVSWYAKKDAAEKLAEEQSSNVEKKAAAQTKKKAAPPQKLTADPWAVSRAASLRPLSVCVAASAMSKRDRRGIWIVTQEVLEEGLGFSAERAKDVMERAQNHLVPDDGKHFGAKVVVIFPEHNSVTVESTQPCQKYDLLPRWMVAKPMNVILNQEVVLRVGDNGYKSISNY